MTSPFRHLRVVASLLIFAGCSRFASHEVASVLPRGEREAGLELGSWVGFDERPEWFPQINLSLRRGMGSNVELSARVGTSGIIGGAKLQLTRPGSRPSLSIGAFTGGFLLPFNGSGGAIDSSIPFIVDVPWKEHHFVFTPRVHHLFIWNRTTEVRLDGHILNAGAAFGTQIAVHDRFKVFPEVTVELPILSATERIPQFAENPWFFGFSLGFQVTSARRDVPP